MKIKLKVKSFEYNEGQLAIEDIGIADIDSLISDILESSDPSDLIDNPELSLTLSEINTLFEETKKWFNPKIFSEPKPWNEIKGKTVILGKDFYPDCYMAEGVRHAFDMLKKKLIVVKCKGCVKEIFLFQTRNGLCNSCDK